MLVKNKIISPITLYNHVPDENILTRKTYLYPDQIYILQISRWFMEQFKKVTENKKQYLELLLLADPSEEMVDQYLETGDMFTLSKQGHVICEAVVDPRGELKNLAVDPLHQKKGIGMKMLQLLREYYRGKFDFLFVGTSDSGVAFYEKCGFRYSHTVKNFFTDHYPAPIFEDGKQCIDMIYLKKELF